MIIIIWRRPDLIIIKKKNNKKQKAKKKTCRTVDFAVPADHRVKLKESEKKDNYHDLARELKKLWNMNVIVIGAIGLVVWVLWHISLCRSFNAKFCLYIHTYSTKDFKRNIKVGRIFYLQDFISLHKINQF